MSMILALIGLAAAQGASSPPVVLDARFYVQDLRNRADDMRQSNVVPLRPATSCYHWSIDVRPENRSVTVREVFELPGTAGRWGVDPTGTAVSDIAADNSAATTFFQESLGDGLLTHGWCVAQGDPAGRHRMRIYVGDHLLREFEFIVVPDTPEGQ